MKNKYIAIYRGTQIEIESDSLYHAKLLAVARLKIRKSEHHMVSVMLAEKDGKPVVHSTAVL